MAVICTGILFGTASPSYCQTVDAAQSTDPAPARVRDVGSEAASQAPKVSQINGSIKDSAKVYVIYRLEHRAADHETADALVRIPADFDITKPLRLVIYNHGFGTNVASIYTDSRLSEQMSRAGANTVLVLPEWQAQPDSRKSDQGQFGAQYLFRAMLLEIFGLIPELQGKKFADVVAIDIAAHSAGYGPTISEIYKNDLGDKIRSIALLDALYTDDGFNKWITSNLDALQRGEKQFYNVFFDSTREHSKDLARLIERLWQPDKCKDVSMLVDYSDSDRVLNADNLKGKSVAFIYSTKCIDGLEQHFSIPRLYFGLLMEASQQLAGHGACN
jgi:hypothetical protein